MGTLLSFVLVLVILGVVLWLVNNYIPLQPPFKQIINIVVVIGFLIWAYHKYGSFLG